MVKYRCNAYFLTFNKLEVFYLELIGVKISNFKGDDGVQVSGARLYCLGDEVPTGSGFGRECETFFVSRSKMPTVPPLGANVRPIYTKYGKIASVEVLG